MMHYLGGFGGFMWFFQIIIFLVFIAIVFWVISGTQQQTSKSAEDILKERLAKGEISIEEYEKLLQEIRK